MIVVHNGIIENYLQLKERLKGLGILFKSETDTEVISHLIEEKLQADRRFRRGGAPGPARSCAAPMRSASSARMSRIP